MAAELPTIVECGRLYLSPPVGAFWRWSDDGSAIVTASGRTILLREELAAYAAHCVAGGRGLPPLQAIVALLAAAQGLDELPVGIGGLPALLHPLWQDVRKSAELRRQWLDCALQFAKANSVEFAERVLAALRTVPTPLPEREFAAVALPQVGQWLREGHVGLTIQRLRLLAHAGVEEPPHAELTWPDPGDGAALLRALRSDAELAGLAGIVQQVQVALHLPRPRLSRAELRVGGAAGVTNRGPLDRLLPSELAHDDDVLAARIATNQALYSEREPPPREPHVRRFVMLDAGVRMWGAPRTYGVAIALALFAAGPAAAPPTFVVASGADVHPVQLGDRDGVATALAQLERGLDGRAALPALFAMVAAEASEPDRCDEVIVVAHRASVADPRFVAACAPRPGARHFVAEVDELGAFRLLEVTARGVHPLAAATLGPAVPPGRVQVSELPAYYAQNQPRLRPTGGYSGTREILACGWGPGGLVLRRRDGSCHVLVAGRHRVHLEAHDRARFASVRWVRLLPLRTSAAGIRLTGAELGLAWRLLVDDRGLLHFVARHGDAQLTLALQSWRKVEGWHKRGRLIPAALAAQLAEIFAACGEDP